jgi:hypothetical protein
MLPLAFKNNGDRRCFLNVDTGERILVGLPESRCHHVIGPTAEGLTFLCRKEDYLVQLLNPLTVQLTDLPDATTLLEPSETNRRSMDRALSDFHHLSAGLAADSSMVVLHFGGKDLAVARPSDERWTQITLRYVILSTLTFAGRFYCATSGNISVLDACRKDRRPRLVFAAAHEMDIWAIHCMHLHLYLVDNGGGELTLVGHIRHWGENGCWI